MSTDLELRGADLKHAADFLKVQHDAKLDANVPATAITSHDGVLTIQGMSKDGQGPGRFAPTPIMDGHFADRLGVPVAYLRRLRAERVDLYDSTINGLLHGGHKLSIETTDDFFPPDGRNFLVRSFTDPEGGTGVGRALLSDRFAPFDNLDMVLALLDGVRATGEEVEVDSMDLTERRMVVKLVAPKISVMAEDLLRGYEPPEGIRIDRGRDPLAYWRPIAQREGMGYEPGSEPMVFAGLVATNGETGGSRWTIGPRFMVKICKNGLIITQDIFAAVHLGGKLDAGVVRWSIDTQRKNMELIAAQTRDSVSKFLNADYVQAHVDRLTETAGTEVTDAVKTVEFVSKELSFTDAQRDGILDHFIKGHQFTAGGVMQAVTSFSRTVENGDTAHDLEMVGVKAMEVAAKAQRQLAHV
jgi:hypothetical protein